jgi:hypothetical protein
LLTTQRHLVANLRRASCASQAGGIEFSHKQLLLLEGILPPKKRLPAPMIAGYRFTMAAEEQHTATSRSGQYRDIDFLRRLADLTARVW